MQCPTYRVVFQKSVVWNVFCMPIKLSGKPTKDFVIPKMPDTVLHTTNQLQTRMQSQGFCLTCTLTTIRNTLASNSMFNNVFLNYYVQMTTGNTRNVFLFYLFYPMALRTPHPSQVKTPYVCPEPGGG